MEVQDAQVKDYFNIPNALTRGDNLAARVSFEVHWKGPATKVKIHDTTNDFGGVFKQNSATLEWAGKEKGFKFKSDEASSSTSSFALLGKERNGQFFPED